MADGMLRINGDAFRFSLEKLQLEFREAVGDALREAARAALENAQATDAFKDRTGKLRAGTKTRVFVSAYEAQITNSVPYARIVERGSKAHEILPSKKKALRWVQNGAVRFARRVWHPGTAPTRFLQRAAEHGAAVFKQDVEARLTRLFAR